MEDESKKKSVTIEKLHIQVGAACLAAIFLVTTAFAVGRSTGGTDATVAVSINQLNGTVGELKTKVQDELNHREQDRNDQVQLKAALLLLQGQFQDFKTQVQNQLGYTNPGYPSVKR